MSTLRATFFTVCLAVLAAAPALAQDYGRTADREAITALMWKYARALDTGNAEAYAALYMPDGQFGVGANATKGREALKGMFARTNANRGGGAAPAAAPAPPALLHMTADAWIEFKDDTHAVHHSYWITMRMASGDTPASVAAIGVGADELVKVNGQWFIQVRNVNAGQ